MPHTSRFHYKYKLVLVSSSFTNMLWTRRELSTRFLVKVIHVCTLALDELR